MVWVQIVLGMLVGEAPEETWRRRRRWIVGALVVLVALLGLAGAGWLVVQGGIHGWQTGDWERLDAALFLLWPFVFMLVFLPLAIVVRPKTPPWLTQQFRDLVASSDARVSFPAVFQPAPLQPHEVATGAHTFQRLVAAESWPQRRLSVLWPVMATQYITVVSNLHRALGTVDFFGIPITSVWYFLLTFFLPMCVVVVVIIVFGVQLVRRPRMNITADEQGLTWQRSKRAPTQRMSWDAVRSFSVLVYNDTSGLSSRRTAFLVDGGDAQLAWALYSRALFSGSGPDEYGEAWQLSRQIVTRSGHMLRDLAPLAMSLATTGAKPDRLRAIGAPEPLIGGITATKRRTRRSLFVVVPLAVGLLALLFVSVPGMGYARYRQQHYFAGLVANIHAGKQLYHNALTASDDDNEWPALSPGVATSQGIVAGAYQMSAQKGNFATWTLSPFFQDMAVEVTTRLSGPAMNTSGAGLIVRANHSENDLVVFTVDPFTGSWSLAHYVYNFVNADKDWHTLDDGTSMAIHRGDGVENTLLALARGDVILLYINGQLVTAYSAQDHFNEHNYDAPPMIDSGYVGVYDNNGANVARFNDFTVYAIKSPPSLDYA